MYPMSKIFIAFFCVAVLLTCGCNQTNTQQPNDGNAQTNAVTKTTASSGGALDDINGLLHMDIPQYMVEFQTPSSDQNPPGNQITKDWYYKNGLIRTNLIVDQNETRTYVNGSNAFTCINQAGNWTCYIIARHANISNPLQDMKDDIDSSQITPLPDKVIAGANAKCFKSTTNNNMIGAVGVMNKSYCLSPEGVPLYEESTGTSIYTSIHIISTATKYSTQVSDSDFILPAEPQDFPV